MKPLHIISALIVIGAIALLGSNYKWSGSHVDATPSADFKVTPEFNANKKVVVSESVPVSPTATDGSDGVSESADEWRGTVTATARISRSDGSAQNLQAIDGEFPRLTVRPNEILQIRVDLKNLEADIKVLLETDNGGSFNRQRGPLALEPSRDGGIEFQFAIGGHRGRYAVLITQGHRQELMEFRVGIEPPVGMSGPLRTFRSDT